MRRHNTGLIWLLGIALFACAQENAIAQHSDPPEQGGVTYSLGMPPVYKGRAGFELQWYRPNTTSSFVGLLNFGLKRDIGSPVIGIAALILEGYGGFRGNDLDGGGRALFNVPSIYLAAGADYNARDEKFSFLLQLDLPLRRGGVAGRASVVSLRWLPGRGNTFGVGITYPLWGVNLGKTRARHDYVRLVERESFTLPPLELDPTIVEALDSLRDRTRWIADLTQPFAEVSGSDPRKAMQPVTDRLRAHWDALDPLFPVGHTLNEEVRVYHEILDFTFSRALSTLPVSPWQSTEAGRHAAAKAREILLDYVLLPYNRLLGQRKTNDTFSGFNATARAQFVRWLLADEDLPREQARVAYRVFHTLCDLMEENRARLRERWEDSRFVWMPLQYGLKQDEHGTQAQLDTIIERALGRSFTRGNRIWYVMNEEFQWEIARSVRRAEDYHVLWIHDISGKNAEGDPDRVTGAQAANYLLALIERVQAYDRTGTLPIYMIFLDQHYFELNKGRYWLRLLKAPLDFQVNLPDDQAEFQAQIRNLQQQLRQAVDSSYALQVERRMYGEAWLKSRIKVHINITNPADFSFASLHMAGVLPMTDNVTRDHRKIAFYDITEADPYRGMAMFTGMGIGEHYIGPDWEDRALMLQGPGALEVKNACRRLVESQGFEPDEIPFPLRPLPFADDYEQKIEAELAKAPEWSDDQAKVLQVHNETGFRSKEIDVAKAVLYSLMPAHSVIVAPDALWQSYPYASLLAGSALRGCRVLIIAPTQKTAPSAGAPQLIRAHDLIGRLVVFDRELADLLDGAGGLIKTGLYSPRVGVGDLPGRIAQSSELKAVWIPKVYPDNQAVEEVSRGAGALLDSIGYKVTYLTGADSVGHPKMHLKANFFASGPAWDRLLARPEWGPILREYIIYLARQSPSMRDQQGSPNVQAMPDTIVTMFRAMARSMLEEMSPQERREIIYYFTLGSVNMDYRSMCLDGEAMVVAAGWQSVHGMFDFILLGGLAEWLETTERLDALLPRGSGLKRSMANWLKIIL